jgi:phosphate transport system substrate-binding protein
MTTMKRSIFRAATFAAIILPACTVAQTKLTGAGASFPDPLYTKWTHEYLKARPDVQINYSGTGSGAGIRQVTDGTVDFGASDMPMTDSAMAAFKEKRGTDILHFPTTIGAVVPVYNLPSVTAKLKFSGAVLARIFLGTITKWNDAAITALNPGVSLPNSDIIVVHRADGSGTTFVWTDFLSKVSPDWKSKVGSNTSVKWPVGLGGNQNAGVAGLVQQTQGSLGYVELVYAEQNKIAHGAVQNAAGEFVVANLASVSAAAAGAAANMPADFRVSITNAPGKGVYPIASFTWLLVPAKFADAAKQKAMTEFLKWMLKDGQKYAAPLSYAELPSQVIAKETPAIAKIK